MPSKERRERQATGRKLREQRRDWAIRYLNRRVVGQASAMAKSRGCAICSMVRCLTHYRQTFKQTGNGFWTLRTDDLDRPPEIPLSEFPRNPDGSFPFWAHLYTRQGLPTQ